ncbi:triose-phosphate isomerase family protein [Phycicoccus sonneratiae]|uniref:triose-phosphate isomerase family protein n=1 Tax=Phycicoccus sonneratiae TaxID=2807628 RepID=UPI0027DABCD8|nr:triose-phosphate isomerase [Phycicoccus sonneraticus]
MWLGTSWKMTKTLAEARAWTSAVTAVPVPDGVEAFVLPSHTALSAVRDAVPSGHRLRVGAQDAHWSDGPERTGEVSVAQVRDAGASLVEVGHSERRLGLGEDDALVARKARAVLDGGLTLLLCVGETAEVRAGGGHRRHVAGQVRSALAALRPEQAASVVVAYEPVWSIGVDGRPAAPTDVAPVVDALRAALTDLASGVDVPVLYGGSVDPANAEALLDTGVDGLFVGRAAWEPGGYLALLDLVAQRAGRRVTQ